jgi:hypothetical protein
MPTNIEQQKEIFLNLLRHSFKLQQKDKILIKGSILKENGLDTDTFWKVICPLFKKEGVLRDFKTFNLSDLSSSSFYESHPEYRSAIDNLKELFEVRDGIRQRTYGTYKDIYEEIEDAKNNILENFEYEFIVDINKIKKSTDQSVTSYRHPLSEIKNAKIKMIDILKDGTKLKKVTIFINTNYAHPKEFLRRKNWGLMYQLAEDQQIPYEKGFLDYFNSNKKNPLYAREGYVVTKILKQEGLAIVPEIKIGLITQKTVTLRINSA